MPRQARIDAPDALHHIMVRGIERREIFRDNKDKDGFVERLGDIIKATSTSCYAWSLLSNHVHLLLRTGCYPIATEGGRSSDISGRDRGRCQFNQLM